jgi:hypothetical protein
MIRPIKMISGSIALAIILYFNAQGTTLPPNDAIDVKHYNFQLELNDSTGRRKHLC